MRLTLKPHPDTPCEAVREIAVEVAREGRILSLHYVVTGDLSAVLLADRTEPIRTDDLWKHSCFEAFIAPFPLEGGYSEINLSPSGAWAVYRFTSYREGMTAPEGLEPPRVSDRRTPDRYQLEARFDLDLPASPWRLGLSAVIELKDGSKSYWALAHAPGHPDFHHPDAFAGILSPESP